MRSAVLAGSVISDFGHISGSPVSSMWSSMCACMYLLVAELLHLGIGLRVDLLEHRGARLQGDARVCEA
eukprot:scaffold96899_cov21-Phaeocystis_antarctica.AAC.1